MRLNTLTRPSAPLTAACAASVTLPTPPATPVVVPALAAARSQVSRAHQVQVQAELAQAKVRVDETNSTTGFEGLGMAVDGRIANKRYADAASGVPPRGRPV